MFLETIFWVKIWHKLLARGMVACIWTGFYFQTSEEVRNVALSNNFYKMAKLQKLQEIEPWRLQIRKEGEKLILIGVAYILMRTNFYFRTSEEVKGCTIFNFCSHARRHAHLRAMSSANLARANLRLLSVVHNICILNWMFCNKHRHYD